MGMFLAKLVEFGLIFGVLGCIIGVFWKPNGQHTLLLVNCCGINCVMLFWVLRILGGQQGDVLQENCLCLPKVVSIYLILYFLLLLLRV